MGERVGHLGFSTNGLNRKKIKTLNRTNVIFGQKIFQLKMSCEKKSVFKVQAQHIVEESPEWSL